MDNVAGKRLVIFGCGYVGTGVALQATARNMRVTALTRSPESALVLREQGIEAVAADLAGTGWHQQIDGGADFVLNSVSSGGGGIEAYRRSYVEGMASIAQWARSRGAASTMVYTSSTSVYPQDGGAVVDETAPTEPASERAALLLEAERILREARGACGRWFVLRLGGIYGPGRHHFVDQVRSGEVSGTAEQHLNLVHREDVVAAVWACFQAPAGIGNDVFNVVDDGATRKSDVAGWLAGQLHVPPPRFTGLPAGGRRSLTPDRVISNAKLKSRLGWRPRYSTFREGCANFLSR